MDTWSPYQISKMLHGGNDSCKQFLQKHNVTSGKIKEKYDTPVGQLYQQVLEARVNGQPAPTELPSQEKQKTNMSNATTSISTPGTPPKKRMEGFGSSPHPSQLLSQEQPTTRRERRRQMILGMGAAAVGALAVGITAARNRRQNGGGSSSRMGPSSSSNL
jgi:hypothetical protein